MQIEIEEIKKKQQEQIDKINATLKARAQKFGAEIVPITIDDYKLYKIKKAAQTGILLQDIQNIQDRKNKIKQRTNKFFPDISVQTNNQKFFKQKQNPDYTQDTTKIRYNVWYLFGVDYMSNQKIRNYFHCNQQFKIQWINDSSCNICFNSKQQAQEAIQPLIKGNSIKDEQEVWFELQQYQIDGVYRKLFCRLATNKDIKDKNTSGHQSKYYKWEINKKKINNFVKHQAHQYIFKQKKIKKYTRKEIKNQQNDQELQAKNQEDEQKNQLMKEQS